MDVDWDARIEKWSDGIPRDIASKADFKEYLSTKLHEYDKYKSSDYNLWELFRHDFNGFSVQDFKDNYSLPELQAFRAYLRCGGVYVKITANGHSIAQTLADVLTEETMGEWNDAEIVGSGTVGTDIRKGPITSVFLTPDGLQP
jgi:hypothetical protein